MHGAVSLLWFVCSAATAAAGLGAAQIWIWDMGPQDKNLIVSDSAAATTCTAAEGGLEESCEFSQTVAPGKGEKE